MKKLACCSALLLTISSLPAHADDVVQFLGQGQPSDMSALLTADQIAALPVNPADYACFLMDMVDPTSDNQTVIGQGMDCLIFHPIPGRVVRGRGLQKGRAFEGLAGDVAVEALSIFSFNDGRVFVTTGLTSVKPMLEGFGNGGSPQRTHITGSIPTYGVDNNYLLSINAPARSASVRVSGSLRADELGLFFDCLWILED